MNTQTEKNINLSLKILTAIALSLAFISTFTVNDYYIFARFKEYGVIFCLSRWVMKAGLLLLPMAVYYKSKSCADVAKYVLPPFIILSTALFKGYFDIFAPTQTPADEVYAHINGFIPKWLNMTLYFAENAVSLAICAMLFAKDGKNCYKVNAKSFIILPFALIACMPLNLFENFFDINKIPENSFLRFGNFTFWHFLAIVLVISVTCGGYFFLKRKDETRKNLYLGAAAIVLLIQYHSKDSVVMGDGYNVYHTVFACIPLFICNIGVYMAALSVFIRKRVLYAICFFVHAAGAVSVFVYFGKPEMSNYGIFCSYSILYFTLTHTLLFALSVLPSALGQYKFKYKDCVVPLLYYFGVIVTASICSALVTSASMGFSFGDYTLSESEWLYPNYAFTQINPLPFDVPPVLTLTVWRYKLNVLYILGLYAAYVGIFFAFNGAYQLFLFVRKKILARAFTPRISPDEAQSAGENAVYEEIAATYSEQEENMQNGNENDNGDEKK